MNSRLVPYGANLQALVRCYAGNRLSHETSLATDGSTGAGGAQWRCAMKWTDGPALDLEVRFEVTSGVARSAGVGVAFAFDDWPAENYLLLPAAVYKSNDFVVWATQYPPLWREPSEFRRDMPTTTTALPRLSMESPRLEQTTGDTASPCMGFFAPGRRQGFLVQTTQGSRFGNHGLTVERTPGGGIRLLVTAPCVREWRQGFCRPEPSDDRAADWQAGNSLTLNFRLLLFPAERLQVLFDRYGDLRKALNPSAPREELPFSAAWQLLEEKFNRDNWVEAHGYYKLAPNNHTTFEVADDPLCFLWQLGWCGGGMMTLPMLAQGSEQTRARAWRNLEMIFDKTQAPSGFFRGIGDGARFYGDGFDRPHPHGLHMVRKSGDWLLFALKQFDLLRRQGRAVPVSWEHAIRRLADAFVRLWEQAEDFGQFVDIESGARLIGGSSAGAVVPAGLVRASQYFNEPRYLEVAEAAARRYCENCVLAGLTTGGPGDALSAPDSESCFALIESFVALLEATGEAIWAQAARDTVRQAATWVMAYDYRFPDGSLLAKSGARSTGAVWANVQNKTPAPGICTGSGDALLRLWRATGDELALDLLGEIAHNLPQFISRADRSLSPAMGPGWMCERVNTSDWEGAAGVGGNLFGSSSWVETALMLTTWEIPGLYVQPDRGFHRVFDHIVAEKLAHDGGSLTLRLTNPTALAAQVKVLCEIAADRARPLPLNALFCAPIISIPAGGAVTRVFHATTARTT
jgi:hypothetical protein